MAFLPSPPSVIADIFPTVSTAVAIYIMLIAIIASILKSNPVTKGFGKLIHAAFLTSVKSTIPKHIDRIYPTIIPINTDDTLKNPFVNCFKAIITITTIVATNRFLGDPKSSDDDPPPK